MKTNVITLLPLIQALLSPAFPNTSAETLYGTAERVSDGDTFTLTTVEGERRIVRLSQIDAPELAQRFGPQARNQLKARLLGKPLRVQTVTLDRYGRTIANVWIADSDVSLEMLAAGLAWVNRRYTFADAYGLAESQARNRRIGLWRDPTPLPPWLYRWSENEKSGTGPNREMESRPP